MSAITERVAAEHGFRWVGRGRRVGCACGASLTDSASMDERLHTAHVAEVTEAAVRAQITADIEAHLVDHFADPFHDPENDWHIGYRYAMEHDAAHIAAGGAS